MASPLDVDLLEPSSCLDSRLVLSESSSGDSVLMMIRELLPHLGGQPRALALETCSVLFSSLFRKGGPLYHGGSGGGPRTCRGLTAVGAVFRRSLSGAGRGDLLSGPGLKKVPVGRWGLGLQGLGRKGSQTSKHPAGIPESTSQSLGSV